MMKTFCRRSIASVMILIMAALVPISVSYAVPQNVFSGKCGDDLTWTYRYGDENDNDLTISGTGDMYDWESVEETPWYDATHNQINSLIIESGVTSIGSHAFDGTHATWPEHEVSVVIPETVTRIGDHAFQRCSMVYLGLKNVEEIGDHAFYGTYIDDIRIPGTVRSIGSNAFSTPHMLTFMGSAPWMGDTPFGSGYGEECRTYTPSGDNSYTAELKKRIGSFMAWYQHGDQIIKTSVGKTVRKSLDTKPFYLGAKSLGDGKLTFKSSNKDVASVDKNGRVVIKGAGKSTITINASKTNMCKAAKKTITLTVYVKGTTLKSVKKASHRKLSIKWNRNKAVSGYKIQYSTSKTFKKNVRTKIIKGNKKTSYKTGKLKKNKRYYVRVRSYKKIQKIRDGLVYTKTYYSKWSKTRSKVVK